MVTEKLNQKLVSHTEPVLVNLDSAEYIRVIKKKKLQGEILQIDFKEEKGDSCKTVAIYAKRVRGRMVDFAVKIRCQTVVELQSFQREGYTFQGALSTEKHYVFIRKL
ncbi:MAG: peroxide stress protein YaaA [Desulfobacteraceae bacterium]|nr:peroxide stress protein YaaA [Desulfobacteraceae bacterium]